jgi:hypothetical protein
MKNNYFDMLNQFTQLMQELPGADEVALDDDEKEPTDQDLEDLENENGTE